MKTSDNTKPLRSDVKLLGEFLGEVLLESESPKFLNKIEELRKLAGKARLGSAQDFNKLQKKLTEASSSEKELIAKAFTEFLRLSNTAEQFHRIRRSRQHGKSETKPQEGSLEWLFEKYKNKDLNKFRKALLNTEVELVFTAHPTEAQRPSAIRAYRKISEYLSVLNSGEAATWEKEVARIQIKKTISALWKTDLLRAKHPTPFDEARAGLATVEEIIWPSISIFFKKLDWIYEKTFNTPSPSLFFPIKFASWMGGDRDGNPYVTHNVTQSVLNESITRALKLYAHELRHLFFELPYNKVSPQFKKKYTTRGPYPYRELLENQLSTIGEAIDLAKTNQAIPDLETRYNNLKESLTDLEESLKHCDLWHGNSTRLKDLQRRLQIFGPALLRLDIRQDREVHENAVVEIFKSQGLNYALLSEKEKESLLFKNMHPSHTSSKANTFTEETSELLSTLNLLNAYPRECFSSYVVSMADSARDILEVYFLQSFIGVKNPIPVVPLFETPESLDKSCEVIDQLFQIKHYNDLIGKKQQVMLGYSDSAKRGGRLASSWQIFQVQRQMEEIAKKNNIEIVFFHGRGGSIGRGGGPIKYALQAMPRGIKSGKIRITEQGESIDSKYGLPEVSLRTLELYVSGVVEAQMTTPPSERDNWVKIMGEASLLSENYFRKCIYDNSDFINYFNLITPQEELSFLQIGSRPKKRKTLDSFDGLRAIPWVFSWTQNRFLVASWLGTGEALDSLIKNGHLHDLQRMYKAWPFFRATLSLIEMILAKSDMRIADLYSKHLVDSKNQNITSGLISSYKRTTQVIKKISEQSELLTTQPSLKQSIHIRNKYVDILNLIQIALLREYRQTKNPELERAIAVTLSGISAGMKNTG